MDLSCCCGIFVRMKASLVRRCLEQFSDSELNDVLEASDGIRALVRAGVTGKSSGRADAALFRRWLRIPNVSNRNLGDLPTRFATELTERADHGDRVTRTLGVRALLALGAPTFETAEEFVCVLTDIRSDDHGAADAGSEASNSTPPVLLGAIDATTDLDAAGVAALYDAMAEAGASLVPALEQAAEDARAGYGVEPSLTFELDEWQRLRDDVWVKLGVPAPPREAGLQHVERIRDDTLAAEAARRAAEVEANRQTALVVERDKLDQLCASIPSLESLAIIDVEAYGPALKNARRQIAELEQSIRNLEKVSQTVLPTDPDPAARADTSVHPASAADGGDTAEASGTSVPPPMQLIEEVAVPPVETEPVTDEPGSPGIDDFGDDATTAQTATSRAEAPITANGTEHEPAITPELGEDEEPTAAEPRVAQQTISSTEMASCAGTARVCDTEPDLAPHIADGRFGAAWVVARATQLPDADTVMYRLAATAFNSAPGGIDPSQVLTNITTLVASSTFESQQTARVALAATLRAALAAGWIPRSEVELLAREAGLAEQWWQLQNAVTEAGDRHYQHLQGYGTHFGPTTDDVRDRARAEREQLKQLRTKFVRADKVLIHLLRSEEPLGAALAAVDAETHGAERRAALTAVLIALQSPDDVIAAADIAVSSPQQRRREDIIKGARATLDKAIESVTQLVNDAINAETTATTDSHAVLTQEAHNKLIGAAKALRHGSTAELTKPGDLALHRLLEWILNPTKPTYATELDVLLTESLPAVSVSRDAIGLPTATNTSTTVVAELANPGTPADLYRSYVDRGDLQQAAAAARSNPELSADLLERRDQWIRDLRNEVAAVRAEIGRTFADDFSVGDHSAAEALLVEPASYTGDRFDLQVETLNALREDLEAHRSRSAETLRNRVAAEITRAADRTRIIELIDSGDLVAANELLALALVGSLPDTSTAAAAAFGAKVFTLFMRDAATIKPSSHTTIRDALEQMVKAAGCDSPRTDTSRLNAWDHLASKKLQGQQRKSTIISVLGELGLDVRGEISIRPTPGSNYSLYRVTATPVDGSLIPGLGSQATHYMVAVTKDANVLLRQALVSAFPDNSGPNIVLFDGLLTTEQRLRCLKVCRNNQTSAIVIDHAVAAYVAVHHRRSFKATQQLTLPFTCFTHYTLVSGHVPDEVFVGRDVEQRQLAARDGSLFVYGGRQLGKTALLKRTAREFSAVDDQHAIYVDLRVHGIGLWAEPQQLWQVLYDELVKIGSMQLRTNPNVRTPDPVKRAITNWLNGKESRRLLVLLDEADLFLEKESIPGVAGFKHIQPLKGLFDDSAGRFKPVFAGLHRVQRLQNVANTPLAHGGSDILIGPLTGRPAYDLVVRPLEALGYRFDSDNLVWRLLAFTNMQPGLIQLVCDQLVTHMQRRPPYKGEPLIVISADDVDEVTQNPQTRDAIASKLRLTIDLEVRYRVIALTVAIMCMDDQFRERYTAADIRLHCEEYWRDGFSDLNTREFTAHLDELIGLGVLTKDKYERYSMRSSNIVTMLGTRDQLETTLTEAEFELEHEYNPRSTRRSIPIGTSTQRSPLSEEQLSQLLPLHNRHDAHNIAVVGTPALGVDSVIPTMKVVAAERRIDTTVIDATSPDTRSQITGFTFTGGGTKRPNLLIVDATGCDADQAQNIAEAVQTLRRRGQGHLVVVYGAAGVDATSRHLERQSVVPTRVVSLEKWSGDGIRSWHDNPFRNEPSERRQLLAATGGWPELVDRAVAEVDRGGGNMQVCAALARFPETASDATEFLDTAGVGEFARVLLKPWAAYKLDTFEPLSDIADILERDPDDVRVMLTDLQLTGVVNERNDQYLLDPVVARALDAIG